MTAVLLAALALASCGNERTYSHGQVTNVRAHIVGCTTARRVAGKWFFVQQRSRNPNAVTVHDHSRPWRCRITQHATGTDPGFIARSKIACTHRASVVRFELRS